MKQSLETSTFADDTAIPVSHTDPAATSESLQNGANEIIFISNWVLQLACFVSQNIKALQNSGSDGNYEELYNIGKGRSGILVHNI